ncbi:hypothetical protein GMMP1_100005 [Candidatus Magnetomoraceae bacterium gMMP-1]
MEKYLKKEVSSHKLISWLKRKNRLAEAIHINILNKLFNKLRQDASFF